VGTGWEVKARHKPPGMFKKGTKVEKEIYGILISKLKVLN
jgi:hypothetical protein